MWFFIRKLISNFRFSVIFWILFLLLKQTVFAQETIQWDKTALRDSVVSLLSKYQELHNKLNNRANQSIELEFGQLFSNPKVQVFNDLLGEDNPEKFSIEEFIGKLGELFPEGLTINMDLNRAAMDFPRYDRNLRYVIKVRINRTLSGISGGKVYSSERKVFFYIAFLYTNNTAGNFKIYGMDLPPKAQSYVTASFSPSSTGFGNSGLKADSRFSMYMKNGYTASVSYSLYFSDHWGLGSGIRFSKYSGSIGLYEFDSFGGFNANLKDVMINNDLWYLEVPLFLTVRTKSSSRLEFRADFGISLGFRVFESMSSSAVNITTGSTLTNVISDPDWIPLMSRFNHGIQVNAGVKYKLTNRWGVLLGGGARQGLSGLDNNTHNDFITTRYLGQYNPLWGAPGKTSSRSFFGTIGVTILLNKEQN